MPRAEQHWYLSIDRPGRLPTVVGTIHKSLTNKLLQARYDACQVLEALRVMGVDIDGTTVAVMRDGEIQAKDEF